MVQQITVGKNGSDSRRVLDAVTPLIGSTAPSTHANFIGQIYIDTTEKTVYISVAIDSTVAADDWKKLSLDGHTHA